MSKRIDIKGKFFSDILVLEFEKEDKTHAIWKCLCMNCNKITYKSYSNLVSGNSKSCSSCGNKRVSNGQKQEIAFKLRNGVKISDLVREYNVSRNIIYRIKAEIAANDLS